ncbi:MAG: methylenetetrahydrofolate reductase [NAD(P)H] [Calditrichae bacterium]|nr:methylenetetrahydrofolate reductase [NAD(P)H] [Calditrichia bacterium]
MHVIDAINNAKEPLLSLEITPPNKGTSIDELYQTMDKVMPFNPAFLNVTYHQPQVVYEEKDNVIYRIPKRKKPGTVGICASIANRYDIETVPHFICGGFSKYETEDALIDLHFLGIKNILALRGDAAVGERHFIPHRDGHRYASELVKQISKMNRGVYLEELEDAHPTNFCIGVAGYPEKHFEAANFEKDLAHLKHKVEQGAHYIITQMFFDFDVYKRFVERARKIGITVPILPGVKPLYTLNHLTFIPRYFHVSIPHHMVETMENARTKEKVRKIGIQKSAELCKQLIDYGVPGIHIYTMGRGNSTRDLLQELMG